jgi:hypothetical protein
MIGRRKHMLPEIESYGNYSSSNYGAHCLRVKVGKVTVWFSYSTPVAFMVGTTKVVSENIWGQTTGKHLAWIEPDKSKRVSREEFEKLWTLLVETPEGRA